MPMYKDSSTGRLFFVNETTSYQQAGIFNPFDGLQPQTQNYVQPQQTQQQQQQQSNPYSTYQNVMSMMPTTTATGMTPNATNSLGESYYGWGAQTGDWGATASPAAVDSASAVGSGSEVAGGSGSYWGYAAPIVAAIAGQHMMSSNTDRRDDDGNFSKDSGHRTGDVFSGNFFTEPWMSYGQQQLGIDKLTAGEKTDAAIDRMREGKGGFSDLAGTIPSTAYQWFDPVGTFGSNFMEDKFGDYGKYITNVLLPHTVLKTAADWLGSIF